jgi:predicted dehydrogenase
MTNIALIGLKGHQYLCLEEIAKRSGLDGRPDEVRLVAVTDDDAALLKGASKLEGVTAETVITPNLDEVLARRDVQVAIVCDDNLARGHNLIACFRRGWHVCAEKPLAISLAELEQVRAAHAAANVSLTMLLTMRFEAPYRAMREQIAAGAIGTPLQLSAQKSYRRGDRPAWQQHYATYGGTIPYIGVHPVDMLQWLTGCTYRRVAALHHNAGLPGAGAMEESCALLLETTDGAVAAIRLDYLRPEKAPSHGDDRVRVAGSTGVIEALDGKVSLLSNDAPPRSIPLGPELNLFGQWLDSLAGKGKHDIAAEECFAVSEVCLRAREAAKTGTWVALASH